MQNDNIHVFTTKATALYLVINAMAYSSYTHCNGRLNPVVVWAMVLAVIALAYENINDVYKRRFRPPFYTKPVRPPLGKISFIGAMVAIVLLSHDLYMFNDSASNTEALLRVLGSSIVEGFVTVIAARLVGEE